MTHAAAGVHAPSDDRAGALFVVAVHYSARRTQQHAVHRASLALEQALDRLERGEAGQPSLLRMIESALPPVR